MKNNKLEEIYKQYYRPLFLYALSFTKNADDAKDLVANTFVKAFLSFHGTDETIEAWLVLVLKNEFYDMYRKRRFLSKKEISENDVCDPGNFIDILIKDERKRWLYEQIYQLNEKEREIMMLSVGMELSDKKIAEILKSSENAVKMTRYRIRKRLKAMAQKGGLL